MHPDDRTGYGDYQPDYLFVFPSSSLQAYGHYPVGEASLRYIKSNLPSSASVFITTLVRRPLASDETMKVGEQRKYLPILLDELKLVNPKKVMVFGGEAAKLLCPGFKDLNDDHGTLFTRDGTLFIPSYRPLTVHRNPTLREYSTRDFVRMVKLGPPQPPMAIIDPNYAVMFGQGIEVALDLETTGFNPFEAGARITKLQVRAVDDETRCYVWNNPDKAFLNNLHQTFVNNRISLVGANLQFDLYWLNVHSGIEWHLPSRDIQLIAHNRGLTTVNLKHLSTMLTDRPGPRAFGGVADDGYAAEDVHATAEVVQKLDEDRRMMPVDNLMHLVLPEAVAMRARGTFVNRDLVGKYRDDTADDIEIVVMQLNEQFGTAASMNWNATADVCRVLMGRGYEWEEKTKTGKPQLTEAVLLSMAQRHPELNLILVYRERYKFLTGFLDSMLEKTQDDHPFLHPFQDFKGAKTGRSSMKDPNLQQVPRIGPLKLAFQSRWAGGGMFICDLSQAELRAAALLSGDEQLIRSLLAADPHRANAAIVYQKAPEDITSAERKRVKGVVFGLLYGGGAGGLAKRVGVSKDEVLRVMDSFFGQYPSVV